MSEINHSLHISHYINQDPEVWELSDRFGDGALRLWLEILSIATLNDGKIPGWSQECSPQLARTLAGICRLRAARVQRILQFFDDRRWTELSADPQPPRRHRVRSYAHSHVAQEEEHFPSRTATHRTNGMASG